MLVLDVKGDMTAKLPGEPLLVAPQDRRSLVWDLQPRTANFLRSADRAGVVIASVTAGTFEIARFGIWITAKCARIGTICGSST